MLSLEDMLFILNKKKYGNVQMKEKAIIFKTFMHLHKGFMDIGHLNCKVGTNNLTYQEIPGVLPVDVFILF